MSRQAETLAKIRLFRSLDAAAIRDLDTQCTWRRASHNSWIIDYQDASNDMFFVVSGTVRVKIQSVSGREILLTEISAGGCFGEIAAIDNQPRSSGIMAVTDVTIARMPASIFRAAVHAHPDVCDQVLALIAGQVRMLTNRVNEFTTLDVRHRIYSELLRLSRPEAARARKGDLAAARARGYRRAREHAAGGGGARVQGARTGRADGAAPRPIVLTDPEKLRRSIEKATELD